RQCDTALSSHLVGYTYTIAHESSKILLHRLGSLEQAGSGASWRGGTSYYPGADVYAHRTAVPAVAWRSPGCCWARHSPSPGSPMGPVLGDNRCPGLHLHSGRRFRRGLVVTL